MRHAVVRPLGRGGMGLVELVRDERTGEELARKRLTRLDPARIGALKRELRLIGSLSHPNLVRLHELGEDADGPFLLMEAVHGFDVVSHCARRGAAFELASVAPQLLSVLQYLHHRGLAHGDLSPANVLVRHDGCVKLLDFGLGAALDELRAAPVGGTAGYVAPERLAGGAPTPEGDLYGLGAILLHVASGAPPAATERPPRIEPPALDAAVRALLDPAPRARPSIEVLERELLPALGAVRSPVTAFAPAGRLARPALEARVYGTLVARPGRLIVLRGRSGIGKTTLARAVTARAADAGMSVSWTRARPEEQVAFNLIDALIDDAAARVAPASATPAVRAAAERAAASFPILAAFRDGDAHAAYVRQRVRAELFGKTEPIRAPRGRLFSDLRVLLEGVDPDLPRRLLTLDDLQWADRDSLAFLESLLDAGGGRTTLLATARDDPEAGPLSSWLAARPDVTFIDVPPIADGAIAAHLETHGGFDATVATGVAAACEGLPALVALALRAPGAVDPLGETVRAVLRDGDRAEKEALAVMLVAGTPIAIGHPGVEARAVEALVRRGLVERTDDRVDLLHDTLREPLRRALGPDWLRAAHALRASVLDSIPGAAAQRVRHLLETRRPAEAIALARSAADRTWEQGAYALAAELYEVTLRSAHDPDLARRRAMALEQACRFDEAAHAWSDLREKSSADAREALFLAEAHALLAGRRIAEGRARLDDALRVTGGRGLGRGALARARTLARFLLGPLPGRERATSSLARAERYLESAALVGYFDTVFGLELLLRARATFDRAGDRERAAWCDFLLAFFARFGIARGAVLSRRYRRAAERRLAGRPAEHAVVRAFPRFLDGYDQLRRADFAGAAATFDRALEMVVGTAEERSFEAQLTTSLRTSAVLATQDVNAAEAAVARFERLARDGVEVAIQCHVENARALVLTWRGRFEEAEDAMARLRGDWPAEPQTVQSVLIEVYAALPAVLRGDAARVRPRVQEACRRARRLRLFGTAYGPIIFGVAAQTEIAARRGGGADLSSARRWARACAARPSVLTGLGHRALAALDEIEGRPRQALRRLELAEREAARWSQAIDAALALYSRGRLTGRPDLQIDARGQLAAAGASPRLLVEHDLLR